MHHAVLGVSDMRVSICLSSVLFFDQGKNVLSLAFLHISWHNMCVCAFNRKARIGRQREGQCIEQGNRNRWVGVSQPGIFGPQTFTSFLKEFNEQKAKKTAFKTCSKTHSWLKNGISNYEDRFSKCLLSRQRQSCSITSVFGRQLFFG
jgi:hypothetical protein